METHEDEAREFSRRRNLPGVEARIMTHGRPNAPTVTVVLMSCGRELGSKTTSGRGVRARTVYTLPRMEA